MLTVFSFGTVGLLMNKCIVVFVQLKKTVSSACLVPSWQRKLKFIAYNVTSNKTQTRCQGGSGRLCHAHREPADCEGKDCMFTSNILTRHCPHLFLLYLCTCRSSPVGVTTSMKLSLPKVRHSWWACPPSSARTSGSREASNSGSLDLLLMGDSDICVVLFVPTEEQDRFWGSMSFFSATMWEKWIFFRIHLCDFGDKFA